MSIVFYCFIALLVVYGLFLFWLALGFILTKRKDATENPFYTPVTIIICARNEEKKIARCLQTIVQQEYDLSKIQIIVVNDASIDSTAIQAQAALKTSNISYKIISNKEQKGKKESISYAIDFAENDLIVLRDADTFTKSYNWLKSISDFYIQQKPDLIIGPVAIANNFGMLWALQAIENNVLSVLNAGSAFYKKPFLANGANLIFTKGVFQKVNGYRNHLHVSSGDDVLFLEDVKKVPESKIAYLKNADAIVSTYPCFSFGQLLHQRVRWASKFKVNKNFLNMVLALLSFVINGLWLFSLFYGFLVPQNGGLSLIFVLLKLFIDILLLFLASRFFKNKALIWYVLPVGCVYPIYACIISIASVFMKPKWK